MVMKRFLGSHKSGLRKNAYVEKILKKKKKSKLLLQYKVFPEKVKTSMWNHLPVKNLEHIILMFIQLLCHTGRVSCA